MKTEWAVEPLGRLAEVIPGQSPKGANCNTKGKGTPFFQGKKDFADRYIGEPTAWTTQVTRLAKANDVLMSVRAPVGPVNLASQDLCIGRGLAAIRPSAAIDTDFLFYCLQSKQHEIKGSEGAVFASINRQQIEAIAIPVPPLPEQRRIVAILDEAFEGIAAAKANAERNLRNAQEACDLATSRRLEESTADHPVLAVADLAQQQKGAIRTGPFGSQLLHSEFVEEGVAVLGIDNAVANEFLWGKRRFITQAKYQCLQRYTVHPGDVVITIMGTCGRCAVIPDDIPLSINSKHLCCISLDRSKCLPEYLHTYFLRHPRARQYLAEKACGSIMDGLNMGIIKEMPVELPPISVQEDVVASIRSLQGLTAEASECCRSKISACDELKASLLYQAFTGQL